jgi:type I restriction enzyme S subunit
LIQYRKLKDLILENKKSNLQVRSSSDLGSYIFFTSGEKTRRSDKKLVTGENIYLATGGKAYVQYYKGDSSYSTDCYSITAVKTLAECKYLYYFLISIINKINEEMFDGAALKHLQKKKLLNCDLLLPQLPIQQTIVAKLDKIFAEIDKVYQLLNKKIKNINFLRESFLDTKLKKINSKVEMSIDEFCHTTDFVANGSFASLAANVKYLDEEDYAILVRLTDYRKNFKSKLKYLTKKSYDFLKHSKLFEGDLILTNVGAYCGTPFLIPKLNKPATLGPNAVLIRPKKEIMSSEFLKIFFESRKGQNLLEAISTGTSHKKFNKTSLRKLKITIPTIVQQSKILDDINKLNNRIRIIEQHTKNNLKNFEFLKQSILQKAFNGELIKVS